MLAGDVTGKDSEVYLIVGTHPQVVVDIVVYRTLKLPGHRQHPQVFTRQALQHGFWGRSVDKRLRGIIAEKVHGDNQLKLAFHPVIKLQVKPHRILIPNGAVELPSLNRALTSLNTLLGLIMKCLGYNSSFRISRKGNQQGGVEGHEFAHLRAGFVSPKIIPVTQILCSAIRLFTYFTKSLPAKLSARMLLEERNSFPELLRQILDLTIARQVWNVHKAHRLFSKLGEALNSRDLRIAGRVVVQHAGRLGVKIFKYSANSRLIDGTDLWSHAMRLRLIDQSYGIVHFPHQIL